MSDQRPQFSPSTLKLSERYGIDPARLDAILGAPKEASVPAIHASTPPTAPQDPSKEWIEARRFETEPAIPVVPAAPAPEIQPVVTPAAKPANVVIPKDVRSTGSTLSDRTQIRTERQLEKQPSTSPLTWILGLALIGLLILFLSMRGCDKNISQAPQTSPSITDTVVKQDTTLVQDTVKVPVDSAATAAAQTPTTSRKRSATGSSRNVALSTTSSFMAQERLAELKADGNPNAYIREVKRNGQTVYQVRTKR